MSATMSSRKPLFWALAGTGVIVVVVIAVALVIAVSGRGGTPRAIGLKDIPMVSGTRVVTKVRSCDPGVHPYCSLQVVIAGGRYASSQTLRKAYAANLHRLGWTTTKGPDGNETAADSPGHELRLTFATAYEDLLGVDSNWIQRTAAISRSLSSIMFDGAPALSIQLLRGSS